MTRRNLGWFVAAAVLTLMLSASAPAFPQDDHARQQYQHKDTIRPGQRGERPDDGDERITSSQNG